MVILEDYIKKESSHWCEGKVCDKPHHYISKEKASEVVILMLWVDELRVGRSLAKEKKRPFSFFKKLKGSTTQDYFEWKKYTHLKKPTPIFSFHPYVCTYITQHWIKSVFLHPNIHHQSEQPTDPVTLKYMGDTIRQKYFLYILLILRLFSGFSFF